MRRGLAAVILGISLLIGSIAWGGFVLSRTILDPERSERLAAQLFDNVELRAALTDRLADGFERTLPPEAGVDRSSIDAAAAVALDDPRVQELIRDGLVQAHQNALNGETGDTTLDVTALGAALRDAFVTERPELAGVVPETPAVEVVLPTRGLSFLGTIRNFVLRVTWITGVLAVAGALIALIITTNRAAVLRRVSFWAFFAAGFWLLVGFGVPWLVNRLAPTASEITAAAIDVFFGAMIPPAIAMGVFGAGLLALSFVWAGAAAMDGPGRGRRLATAEPVPRQAAATTRVTQPQTGAVRRVQAPVSDQTRVMPTSGAQPVVRPGQPATPQTRRPTEGSPVVPPVDRTATGRQSTTPSPAPRPGQVRWVEGLGYVDADGNRVE